MSIINSSYISPLFSVETRNKTAKKIKRFLVKNKTNFTGFVGRGISGVSMASILAYEMNKELVIVRKEADGSHASYEVEGLNNRTNTLIIIDDLIATGNTIIDITEKIDKFISNASYRYPDMSASFVGIILYNEEGSSPQYVKRKTGLDLILTFNND